MFVRNLEDKLQSKELHLKEIEKECMQTDFSIAALMDQMEEIIRTFNDEKRRTQKKVYDHLKRILFVVEHERITLELVNQREELLKREHQIETESSKKLQQEKEMVMLYRQKEMQERAIAEQKKTDENVLRLAQLQKKETEELQKDVTALEKQLDETQALELEIEQIKGALGVLKHIHEDDDMDIKRKMNELREKLKEKKEDLEDLESTSQNLMMKEKEINKELQDDHRELINGLKESRGRAFIGVRQMGELESYQFQDKKLRKNSFEGMDGKALELWNFKEDRPATLKECISHQLKQFMLHKRKCC